MATLTKKEMSGKATSGVAIDAKQAVAIALGYFRDFLDAQLAKANVMLEELEEDTTGSQWLVTLGYDMQNPSLRRSLLHGEESYRAYKTLTIDSKSGKVKSMKIRKV